MVKTEKRASSAPQRSPRVKLSVERVKATASTPKGVKKVESVPAFTPVLDESLDYIDDSVHWEDGMEINLLFIVSVLLCVFRPFNFGLKLCDLS